MKGKIIHLNQDRQSMEETVQNLAAEIEQGKVESLLVAARLKTGEVMTAYVAADYGCRMELIGHLQSDVIWTMIQANRDLI